MTIKAFIAAASTAVVLGAGAASANTVSSITASTVEGTFTADFTVTAINVTNVNSSQSQATMANFDLAVLGNLGDGDEDYASDTFTYSGALKFGTSAGTSTTISSFLASAGGTVSDLDGSVGSLQNSKGSIGSGTATTTFYLFKAMSAGGWSAGTFDIAHDDGVRVVGVGGVNGPTSQRGTRVAGFGGGDLSFLYVSTNSDPSIFRVDTDVTSVPLPAAGWMLLAGLGALGAAARRRKAA